jgi:hypothetical protein
VKSGRRIELQLYLSTSSQRVLRLTDRIGFPSMETIAVLAQQARLPTVFACREQVDAGGLVSYGPSVHEQFRPAVRADELIE